MPKIIIGAVLAQIATGGSTSHLRRGTTVLCHCASALLKEFYETRTFTWHII